MDDRIASWEGHGRKHRKACEGRPISGHSPDRHSSHYLGMHLSLRTVHGDIRDPLECSYPGLLTTECKSWCGQSPRSHPDTGAVIDIEVTRVLSAGHVAVLVHRSDGVHVHPSHRPARDPVAD